MVMSTVCALANVIRHEVPPAMVELRLELERTRCDLERARMGAEDIRSAFMSPYASHGRILTWREFAVNVATDLILTCDAAWHTLQDGRTVGDWGLYNPRENAESAISEMYGSMVRAARQLDRPQDDDVVDDALHLWATSQ